MLQMDDALICPQVEHVDRKLHEERMDAAISDENEGLTRRKSLAPDQTAQPAPECAGNFAAICQRCLTRCIDDFQNIDPNTPEWSRMSSAGPSKMI